MPPSRRLVAFAIAWLAAIAAEGVLLAGGLASDRTLYALVGMAALATTTSALMLLRARRRSATAWTYLVASLVLDAALGTAVLAIGNVGGARAFAVRAASGAAVGYVLTILALLA